MEGSKLPKDTFGPLGLGGTSGKEGPEPDALGLGVVPTSSLDSCMSRMPGLWHDLKAYLCMPQHILKPTMRDIV